MFNGAVPAVAVPVLVVRVPVIVPPDKARYKPSKYVFKNALTLVQVVLIIPNELALSPPVTSSASTNADFRFAAWCSVANLEPVSSPEFVPEVAPITVFCASVQNLLSVESVIFAVVEQSVLGTLLRPTSHLLTVTSPERACPFTCLVFGTAVNPKAGCLLLNVSQSAPFK